MPFLVLMRHGESLWNFENRFTGGTDVPLTAMGRAEAHRAGQLLRHHHITVDYAFSSLLQRAAHTLDTVLSVLGQENIPTDRTPVLNERHYGELQGMDKTEKQPASMAPSKSISGGGVMPMVRPVVRVLKTLQLGCCPTSRPLSCHSSQREKMS